MRNILFITIMLLIFGCKNHNDYKDKVEVYVTTDYEEGTPFKLWVNDIIVYKGKFRPGYRSPYYTRMVAAYIEKSDSVKTFRIQMLDKDTTFAHKMTGVNEVSISVLKEDGYVILDTHDRNAWLIQ